MKNSTFGWCFAGGFLVSFMPFLFPNGAILVLGPFAGFLHINQALFYGPFFFAVVQALRGKEGAGVWLLGSIVAVAIGTILFYTIGFNFVPV